ncbi:MAG: ATP-binding protein [Alloprevotella sp.]
MERKAYRQLLEWRHNPNRKPLILNGARQVGKTWLLKYFGEKEYRNVAYVNCDKSSQVQVLFDEGYDIPRIIRNLSALTNVDIRPHETLVILDEIQSVPKGLPSLKYFCEDAPEYDVAVAGSLLGIQLHRGESFPVGKVDMLKLYPLTFGEFLAARGEAIKKAVLENRGYETVTAVAPLYVELLRQYYFTGGMPAAVKAFVEGQPLRAVRQIQLDILSDYQRDFSKHAPEKEVPRISLVWNSIPSQLGKENRKFVYGMLKKGARAKDYEMAIQWLVDCGLVYKIPRTSKIAMPLRFYEDFSAFKLYMLDVGLFGAMVNAPADQMLVGSSIFEEYKGTFTELYVLQQMKTIRDLDIYYYSTDDSRTEIDFVTQQEGTVTPVEVKAEENLRAKSLRQVVAGNPSLHGLRFSMSNYRREDWLDNVPLYAVESYFAQQQAGYP